VLLSVARDSQAGKIPESKRVMIFCFNRKLRLSVDKSVGVVCQFLRS